MVGVRYTSVFFLGKKIIIIKLNNYVFLLLKLFMINVNQFALEYTSGKL